MNVFGNVGIQYFYIQCNLTLSNISLWNLVPRVKIVSVNGKHLLS